MRTSPAKTPASRSTLRALHPRQLLLLLLLPLVSGCVIGMPVPTIADTGADQGEPVVLVLTHVVVDRTQRSEFNRLNRRVLASMEEHPGLLGHGARRELFGENGWTMSVWANDDARAAFVQSRVHREAIAGSMPALVRVRLRRAVVERSALPKDWDEVIRLLDMPEGTRTIEGGAARTATAASAG
jgi:heme-degrading monooxygenase HmoA